MSARTPRLLVAAMLSAGPAVLPIPGLAQPVAKAAFSAEGSFALPASGAGALERPNAIAWAPSGQIHIADERGPVTVLDASGVFVRSYGQQSLKRVGGVSLDAQGRAYVLDTDQKFVLVFDEAGEVVHSIGAPGDGVGMLKEPVDVAVGPAGLVYVLDKGRKGVQVFSLDGTFVHDILFPPEAKDPKALAVGPWGGVYVTDKELAGAVIRLPSLTEALDVVDAPSPDIGRMTLRGGSLKDPVAVVTTPTGTVVAADRDSGVLWSVDATDAAPVGSDDRLYGGKGTGRGSFRKLADAALAGTDELLLLDRDGRKVERIRLVLEADRRTEDPQDYPVQFQSVSPEMESGVLAVAPTGRGTVWYAVADAEGRNVRVLEAELRDRTGLFGNRIRLPAPAAGRAAHSFGQVVERVGAAALNDTLLVVTEPRRNRVHAFDLRNDTHLGSFGDNYSDDRRLKSPRGVSFFPDGRIAVADHDNGRIAVFSADMATLLGTFPLPKAEGVTVSDKGRMFGWDEDGLLAGEFPLTGGSLRPVPPSMSSGGVGAMATDRAGNLYALRRRSGRVAIADSAAARLLARVGGQSDLAGGDHLTVDPDGNIYATDLERARTEVLRWGVDVPPIPTLTASWGVGFTELRWDAVPGSFITGYQVEGAPDEEGPWTAAATVRESHARVEGAAAHWFRVAARTLTGAVGRASPGVPALHVVAGAAFAAKDWTTARQTGLEALRLVEAGGVTAEPAVKATLGWQGFVAAHEAKDYPDVLAWDGRLGGDLPPEQGFERGYRLADSHRHLGDLAAATDQAMAALGVPGPPATATPERRTALRRMVLEDGWTLGRWEDVTAVGEDLLRDAGAQTDYDLVARVARAHLQAGAPERARELTAVESAGDLPPAIQRTFTILAFAAATDLGDLETARELVAVVGDTVPGDLYADFEGALTRLKVAEGDLPGARAELLAFLLGEEHDIRAMAEPLVRHTTLLVFGGMVESGDAEGARRMLDSLSAAIPPELADARGKLMQAADSVGAVADTRGKLGQGFAFYRDALFRDALRFFQSADARTDLDVDQRLIVKEILAAVFHSLGRGEDADNAFREVFEVEPDFVLDDHVAHVQATYGLTIFTPEMLDHFRTVGPIM